MNMNNLKKEFDRRLSEYFDKRIRKEGLSNKEVAYKAATTESEISKLRNNRLPWTSLQQIRISEVFEMPVHELLFVAVGNFPTDLKKQKKGGPKREVA